VTVAQRLHSVRVSAGAMEPLPPASGGRPHPADASEKPETPET
jgi:hypothetical protein